jgi:hypothetical protein
MALSLGLVLWTPIVVDAAEQESYYLGPEGVPYGELVLNPRGGEMPNYDRGRDVEPGLILERSDRGLAEDDETRFQHWQIEASGERLTGYPSLVVWAAADRFEPARRGVFDVFLLDCNASGGDCEEIGSGQGTIDSGRGATWVETVVDIGAIDHRFAERRNLAVRIVVSEASDTDLIFAYGFTAQRSRLTIYPHPPAGSVVTTVPAPSAPVEDIVIEAALPADEIQVTTGQLPMAAVSVWPWLITLVASTLALVALGAVLMSSLTKPGRHERPQGGGHAAVIDRTGPNSLPAR